jgi:hypothetical protein
MTKIAASILALVTAFALVPARGETDIRALVGRPKETSKRQERKCKVDADCLPISCRTHCGFDGVVNKKSFDAVAKRCQKERDAAGDKLVVACTAKKSTEKVFCKKRYCAMTETFDDGLVKPPGPEEESEDDH